MDILIFVNIEIFVGHVFTFLLILPHQELINNDFLGVLVWSDTSVYKLDYLPYIFSLDDVWHQMGHNFKDLFEVFLLILYDSSL